MKGVYLTQEAKQAIEAKIIEFEKLFLNTENDLYAGSANALDDILSSAIILPIVSWEDTYQTELTGALNKEEFEQGVIIQPK